MKKTLVYLIFTSLLIFLPVYQQACTEGLADGNATEDGRPLHWKVRMWFGTNILQFWDNDINGDGIPETDNDKDGKPDLYSHIGIRSNTNEHPNYENTMMGLNSAGFSIGITVVAPVCKGNTDPLMTHSLGNFSKTSEFHNYLKTLPGIFDDEDKTYRLGNTYGVADKFGMCSEFEYERYSPTKGYVREYKTSNPYRTHISLRGKRIGLKNIVARTNYFHNKKESGQLANLNTADEFSHRYVAAVQNMANLRNKKSLSVLSLLQGMTYKGVTNSFITLRRNSISLPGSNCSTMLIHGVKNNEDVRLTTFWAIMGHSDYSIATPVWILGVQNDKNKKPPHNLTTSIDNDNFASYTDELKYRHRNSYQEIQKLTLPLEKEIIETSSELLMPDWRERNWGNTEIVKIIGKEMNRFQNQSASDAFSLIKHIYDNKDVSKCKPAPIFTLKIESKNGKKVCFEINSPKLKAKTITWNYGDGNTNPIGKHTYKNAGKHLVSCTVTNLYGVSNTQWIFIEISK